MDKIIYPSELNYEIIKYLDPEDDYKILCQTNKYYNEIIKNNKLYKEFKQLHYLTDNISLDMYIRRDKFLKACHYGYLDLAKYLYENKRQIDIHLDDECAFRISCHNGHLNIAKWLYSIAKINIHVANDDVFRKACKYGHLNVVEWLYNLSKMDNNKINIHTYDDEAFRLACYNGHEDIARWLYNLSKMDDNGKIDINESIFVWSYYYLQKNIVR